MKTIHGRTRIKQWQSGVSSLLFIVLVGLSLSILTIGYITSLKSLQSSAITTHAQTQAQMQTMIGYQALLEFLKSSNMNLANVNATQTGSITSTDGKIILYKRSTSCPTGNGNYCFDIIGESGGSKAILRALFKITNQVSSSTSTGSIFAGGLDIQGNATFKAAEGQTVQIYVGGSQPGVVTGNQADTLDENNIIVNPYTGTIDMPSAADLRPFANYIFTKDATGTTATCYKNNLRSGTSNILTETQITCPTNGVSLSNGVWSFKSSSANLSGIIWFDGDVILNLEKTPNDYINTVFATGKVSTALPQTGNVAGTYNLYSVFHYLMLSTDATILNRLNKVCPSDNYPLQYCQNYDASSRTNIINMQYFLNNKLTFIKDLNTHPASLTSTLFMSDKGFAVDAANNTIINFYGNLIGSKGAGGTGMASGKITGTGDINIRGNIVVTGNFVTEMQGNMAVILGDASVGGNNTPVNVKTVIPSSISYQ